MHFKGNKFPINGLFRCTGSEIAWTDDWWAGMTKGAAEVAQVLFTATKIAIARSGTSYVFFLVCFCTYKVQSIRCLSRNP